MKSNPATGSTKYNNIPYLDLLRFIAISRVLLLHIISGITDTMPEQMTTAQLGVYQSLKSFCTVGVPIFFMISGTLFLNPKKELTLKALFQKYLRKIVLALVLFGTFFSFMELVMITHTFSVSFIWQAFVNMLCGNSWAHMWYLFALIGLYLFLPLLKAFTANVSKQVYLYLLMLLFVIGSLLPMLEAWLGLEFGFMMPVTGVCLFYYMCGYYIHTYVEKKDSYKKAAIAMLVFMYLLLIYNCVFRASYNWSYESPVVVCMSICIYYLASCNEKNWRVCSKLRDYYFGMYLVHTVFLNFAYKVLHVTPLFFGGYILLPVFFLGTFGLSLLTAWIMKKIPILGKYVV
ncbi:MAG: acyltransferase [Roseburia sp.]|nr:acyltransferase [Roseburia sp.]